ncbi:MAG: hypothetical protein JWO92_105 [Chitinophagaceae bacterium]|nr:hypothetical protein [Chitinophagaceae bacterium]MDB5224203.1 hypothetical protein [Chitinophagaceae bacterium]
MKRIIRVLSLIMLLFAFTINLADAQTRKKSSRKKGAIIGGVAGAGAGALISKNHRVKGAVVGGAVGAGTGYLIGRHKDKKTGRLRK